MNYNPDIHHRRSIRLKGYDYSQAGLYFITLYIQDRLHLFGKITNDEMVLNDSGMMIEKWWNELKNRFPNIELDEFVVMPNHFHGIIQINPIPVGADLHVCPDEHDRPDNADERDVGEHIGSPLHRRYNGLKQCPPTNIFVMLKIIIGHRLTKNCGNEIIMNTLSVMKNPICIFQNISGQIR